MFVCLTVCLSVDFFSVKYFSATTQLRALKYGTKNDSDEFYCVSKNSYILLISPFICTFFFLSNENFCRRILRSFLSQCFQILFTLSVRQGSLCKS